MKCSKCGYENGENALYCGLCYEVFRKANAVVREPKPEKAPHSEVTHKENECFYHPGTPSDGFCTECKRELCRSCMTVRKREVLCKRCDMLAEEKERRNSLRLGYSTIII